MPGLNSSTGSLYTNPMSRENLYKSIKMLSVVGIFLASFLMYNFIVRPAVELCTISATVNCDAVTKGSISTFLGVPVPLVGLVGYIVILVSAVYKKPKLVLGMALFGTLFCLRLTFLEIFVLHVYCPVCLMCQVVMLTLVVLGFWLMKVDTKHDAPTNL